MNKLHWAGWAIAAVAVVALALGLGNDDAHAERILREQAVERAQQADSALRALRESVRADSIADARQDSILADSLARAQEAAQEAEREATTRTARLRSQLTARQQAQLDSITEFWSTALAEERSATQSALDRLRIAEGKASRYFGLALEERERGDRWKAAYEAAQREIDALRKPEFFSLEWDDGPKILAALAVGYVAGS